ncbi:hypothetical protein [Nostoc sp. 2RC]|uniref:hypothetical protein n=1 Tax=Nostoc sp. 2RC TaxID=2485484 RepID=UPI001623B4E6|nr:hypothetical protein [Nostoc sp. 2RC]MBC1238336.1 hypothetical protein [Nostoc sp. 2RC]
MKNLAPLKDFGSILCPLILAGVLGTTAQEAQPQSAPGPISAPNVTLSVQRSSGRCPQAIGLWWFTLQLLEQKAHQQKTKNFLGF